MSVNGFAHTNGVSHVEEFDAIIVGSGFGGVYLLHSLRSIGYKVKVIEAGENLGGIWYWNSYPGARVDTHWPFYELAAKELWEDWTWTERFPARDELVKYFEHVDKKWDLKKDILFGNRVTKAQFNEAKDNWTVFTDKGYTATAPFFLPATGFAAKHYIPKIKGMEKFKGECHHTGVWPQGGVPLEGKKVGVIGTGASGIQVIQEIAPVVKHLTVFQRTANNCLPMRQEIYNDAKGIKKQMDAKKGFPALFKFIRNTFGGFDYEFLDKVSADDTPEERIAFWEGQWEKGGFTLWLHNYKDILRNPEANRAMYDFWRDKIRAKLVGLDPELIENLAPLEPENPFGTKRPSLEVDFYENFFRDNVDLFNLRKNPIAEMTETGVIMTNGEEIELDVLVLATGFDAVTGSLNQIEIVGIDGARLSEKWAKGVYTNLGIAAAGFPNMFFMYGPQGPTAFAIGPRISEIQGDWIIGLLEEMKRHHHTRIDSSPAAEEVWKKVVDDLTGQTLMTQADTSYMGSNIPGKPREALNYMGGIAQYEKDLKAVTAKGYDGFIMS